MIPYLTYREEDNEGKVQYYILKKDYPNYIGKITDNYFEKSLIKLAITKHNLWVSFNGTLMGNVVPGRKEAIEEIRNELFLMAEWFYENRILVNENKYKKYRIKDDTVIPK